MKNIAVFCSGFGSNLQAIIDAAKKKKIKARVRLIVSDVPSCFALKRARKEGIETFVLEPKKFPTREAFDREIMKQLRKDKIELIVLAGFMRLLSGHFVRSYKNKIINVHPALLPCFKGTHGIKDAYEYGVKVTGATVHFVDEKLDHGPVILQKALEIKENDTLESLEKKMHKIEHEIYPLAIKLLVEGKVKIVGRKTKLSTIG